MRYVITNGAELKRDVDPDGAGKFRRLTGFQNRFTDEVHALADVGGNRGLERLAVWRSRAAMAAWCWSSRADVPKRP